MLPASLQQFVGQESAKSALNAVAQKIEQTPHLMISGPPRVGKTCLVRLWLQELLHMSIDHNPGILFHDCLSSGKAGIDFFRGQIRPYLDMHYKASAEIASSSARLLSFRWIVLDHAEKLSLDTQQALVRLAETRMTSCRIILIVQQDGLSKMNDALKSRCAQLLLVDEPCTVEAANLVIAQYALELESIGWTSDQVLQLVPTCGTMSDFFARLTATREDFDNTNSCVDQWLECVKAIHRQAWTNTKERALIHHQAIQYSHSVACLILTTLAHDQEALQKACVCISMVEQTCLENLGITLALQKEAQQVHSWLETGRRQLLL